MANINETALAAEYERLVKSGRIQDTTETLHAFVEGWNATRKFDAAYNQFRTAGSAYAGGAIAAWLYGGIGFVLISILFLMGDTNYDTSRAIYTFIGCILLIGLGFYLRRKGQIQAAEAETEFNKTWK